MRFTAQMELGGNPADRPAYRVEEREGCKIIYGSIAVSEFSRLTTHMPKNMLVDARLSTLMGATLVMGTCADLDRLKASLESAVPLPQEASKL